MLTRSSLALAAIVGSLVAAGCGGGTTAALKGAAPCDARVGASSNANGVLWAQSGGKPAVYAVSGSNVIAPSGVSRVPAGSNGIGFWACSPHSLLYTTAGQLRMNGAHGPTTIGTNGLAAPNGRFLTYHGSTIRYTNGEKLAIPGIGSSWQITAVAVDPKNPHVVFANVVWNLAGIEECKKGLGIAYRVTPTKASKVLDYDPCHINPLVAWSPDGNSMSFVAGPQQQLYIADAYGRGATRLATDVGTYVWSPDGSKVAYDVFQSPVPRVAVVDVATGRTHIVADGTLGAWSPDGKAIAVMSGSSLLSVPVTGGHPQKLASLS